MSAGTFTELIVEEAALGWLEALGYAVLHGPSIAAQVNLRPSAKIRTIVTLFWSIGCSRRWPG